MNPLIEHAQVKTPWMARVGLLAAAAMLIAALSGGCASGAREHYFRARSGAVGATPGDQSVRLTSTPWTQSYDTLARVDTHTPSDTAIR